MRDPMTDNEANEREADERVIAEYEAYRYPNDRVQPMSTNQCSMCHALVLEDSMPDHIRWHMLLDGDITDLYNQAKQAKRSEKDQMARSTYIYVVTNLYSGAPKATFTVKHEMVSWLQQNVLPVTEYRIWRFPDGGHSTPADITDQVEL